MVRSFFLTTTLGVASPVFTFCLAQHVGAGLKSGNGISFLQVRSVHGEDTTSAAQESSGGDVGHHSEAAYGVSEAVVSGLRYAFDELDQDGSGTIDMLSTTFSELLNDPNRHMQSLYQAIYENCKKMSCDLHHVTFDDVLKAYVKHAKRAMMQRYFRGWASVAQKNRADSDRTADPPVNVNDSDPSAAQESSENSVAHVNGSDTSSAAQESIEPSSAAQGVSDVRVDKLRSIFSKLDASSEPRTSDKDTLKQYFQHWASAAGIKQADSDRTADPPVNVNDSDTSAVQEGTESSSAAEGVSDERADKLLSLFERSALFEPRTSDEDSVKQYFQHWATAAGINKDSNDDADLTRGGSGTDSSFLEVTNI